MENLLLELNNLLIFLISFGIIYAVCVVGSLCGMRFNQLKQLKNSKTKKKFNLRRTIAMALASSVVPSLAILVAEFIFPNISKYYIVKYAVALSLGFIGTEKLTDYMSNLPLILKIIGAVSKSNEGAAKLAKIFEELEKAEAENNEKEKSTDDNNDDNQ